MRSLLPALPAVLAGLLCSLLSVSASAQRLECVPCTYDFGNVNTGTSVSSSIQLTNASSQALTILSKSEQGSAFSFGNFPLPVTLESWVSVELPVIFAPTATGYTGATLTLISNTSIPILTIDVAGTGTGTAAASPKLKISPAKLNFGSVAVGSNTSLQATLTASKAAVTISSDRSTTSEFAIVGLNLPVTIPAGKSIPVTIQFTPASSGTDHAKVGFISNATNSPTVEPVTGTGTAQGSYSVSLAWTGDATAVGYNVLRGKAAAGPFQQINTALDSTTDYTDSTVAAGATYYYVTTAVNAQGEQSGYSNVTEAVIPN
jgi:phosphohistidine swiveling domain-containing protein